MQQGWASRQAFHRYDDCLMSIRQSTLQQHLQPELHLTPAIAATVPAFS